MTLPKRRSWLQQSAHRTGGGVHQDSRAKREEDAKALEEAYADADAFHARLEREWLEAHPDFDPDEQQDTEQEARERKP